MSNTGAERCKSCHDCAIRGRANDRARNVSGSQARGYIAVRNGMPVAELSGMIKRFLAFSLLLVTAACGGSASPTEPGSPAGASGASISGTVSGTQSALTASGANAIPGLVVTVAGTSISSGVDAAGRFTLNGVPGGDIQLQFSGPVSATITISNVQTAEKITLVIAVSGSTVTVQAQTRTTGKEEQLEGLVEAVSPSSGSLKVAGRDVVTDASTEIRHGNTPRVLGDLKVGYRVHVKGQTSGSALLASSIFLQNTNVPGEDEADDDDDSDDQDSSASIHGTLTAMSGSVPTLTLTVGGTTVRTSSSTDVKRRGDSQTLNELRVGMDVHVVGTRQSDGSLDARKIEIRDDATGGEVEIAGAAGGVSGSCPTLSFGINGYSIRTNASTTFEGITCAALKSGTKVTVKGISQGDNSVLATSVKAN